MSQDHTLMASRYELKYRLSNSAALRVRKFVQQYLELDEYGQGQPDLAYPVHSLYLDSDDWTLYHRSLNGDKNRFKLRVRYYDERPTTPVFFEIKRRMKDVILKQRCGVKRGGEADVLAGHFPPEKYLLSKAAEDLQALHRFQELMLRVQAKPQMHVAYRLEAYVNTFNNEVRVTFDRFVRAVPRPGGELVTHMDKSLVCTTDLVILELKFTDRFPNWFRNLVETFDCFQSGAAKYVEGTTLHLGRHLSPADVIRNLF